MIITFVNFLKNNWLILVFIVLAVTVRLYFSFGFAHDDLLTQYGWGKLAHTQQTLKGFYDWTDSNHPPLISALYYIAHPLHSWLMKFLAETGNFIAFNRLAPTMFIWFFDFTLWFGTDLYHTTPHLSGIVFLLKQFMILADLAIAVTIFFICRKNKLNWQKPVLLYLLLPFSWYLSAAWGQSDQLSFLFLLLAVTAIFSKRFAILSPFLYAVAVNFKPTSLILAPVFLLALFWQKIPIPRLIIGFIAAIAFTLWTVSWFTYDNILLFTFTELLQKLDTGEGLINYNAFNFWYIFYPYIKNQNLLDDRIVLALSVKTWGWILSMITVILGLIVVKARRMDSVFAAMFITGFGTCLFLTGIHERYYFIGIMFLLLTSIYHPQYWKYFLIMSIIYTLNLVQAYLPWDTDELFNNLFKASHYLIPRILSVANVVLYLLVTVSLVKQARPTVFYSKVKTSDSSKLSNRKKN